MAFDPNLGFDPSYIDYTAPLDSYNRNFDPNTGKQGPTGGVGANPYAPMRYGYQGPGYDPYGSPTDINFRGLPSYLGNSIDAMAQNNRNRAVTGGEQIGQNLSNYTGYQYGQSADFQDRLNSAWDPIAQGRGGYTDAQKAAILNNQYLQSLQLSPEQAQGNYLTGDEQAGITGNPYAAHDYAEGAGQNITGLYSNFAGQVGDALGAQNNAISGQLVGGANNIRGAYNENAGRQYHNLSDIAGLTRGAQDVARSTTEGAYGQMRGDVGSALSAEQRAAMSYVDPRALTVSDEYSRNYGVSPEDMQAIENKAGRTVGAQAAMDEENLQQQARAQGNTSPLALTAARNRIRQTGAVNSANAMSDAAINAKQLQLQTSQNRENTRLGAEQHYAGLGTGTSLALGNDAVRAAQNVGQIGVNAEMGLGTQGLQNEQYMGSNTLGTQNQIGQNAQGAEQYLSGQQQQAQQYMGDSALRNTQQLLGTGMQQGQFNAALGTSTLAHGEQQQSDRNSQMALNRQGINAYNQNQQYNRGQFIYGAGSSANLNFANNQQGQDSDYRKYLTGRQQQANTNTQIGNQQQLTNYKNTNDATNDATNNAIKNYVVPGFGNQVFSDVWSVVNTAKSGLPHAKGGVRTGPVHGLVGEAGPEIVLDFHKPSNGGHDYLAMAKGGVSIPQPGKGGPSGHHPYGRKGAPKGSAAAFDEEPSITKPKPIGGNFSAHLVTKPTTRILGGSGVTAVIPLTKRPGNKLGLKDIPKLIARYGG